MAAFRRERAPLALVAALALAFALYVQGAVAAPAFDPVAASGLCLSSGGEPVPDEAPADHGPGECPCGPACVTGHCCTAGLAPSRVADNFRQDPPRMLPRPAQPLPLPGVVDTGNAIRAPPFS